MTEESALRERLADLAGDLPPVPVDPSGLWSRGVRRHLRRRAAYAGGSLAVAFALVAGVVLGRQWFDAAEPGPVKGADDSSLMLPDNFYAPSPWLESTDDEGEIGPLAAVIPAENGSLSARAEPGLVGVSGRTGEYRFLGLDRPIARDTTPALSADGRYVAYWFLDSGEAETAPLGYAQGWSVHDTVTGKEQELHLSEWASVEPTTLVWVKNDLWLQYTRWDGVRAKVVGPLVWSPLDGAPDSGAIDEPELPGKLSVGQHPTVDGDELVWAVGDEEVRLSRGGVVRAPGPWAPDDMALPQVLATRSGNYVALLDEVGPEACCPNDRTMMAHLGSGEAALMHRIPVSVPVIDLVGWQDDQHVITLANKAGMRAWWSVDVSTGAATILTSLEEIPGVIPVVAADAWSAPTYHAEEPDWPMNPRFIVLGGLAGGLALLAVLVLARRRRGRR